MSLIKDQPVKIEGWRMTDHYYTFSRKVNDSVSVLFIFLDTPPLISQYYTPEYPEIANDD
jgi:hypothetical protein